MIKIAINGFGRIGRLVYRLALKEKNIHVKAITYSHGVKAAINLLEFDSVHGRLKEKIKETKKGFTINGKETIIINEREIEKMPWKKLGIDVVVESTGKFRKHPDLEKHLNAGAKKVILCAPAKDDETPSVVLGVNEKAINEKIIDNASCTTNCLAPIAKILNDSIGIKNGFMTTIHAYTSDQRLLDGSHKDLRRARNAATNIVPTSTGAAIAIGKIIPELKGKLDGIAIRVPVPDGSLIDLVFESKKQTTVKEINELIKKASKTTMKGIIKYTEKPIVSSDVIGNTHSTIFDGLSTKVIKKMVKILAWYDNETGYSQRIIDLIKKNNIT